MKTVRDMMVIGAAALAVCALGAAGAFAKDKKDDSPADDGWTRPAGADSFVAAYRALDAEKPLDAYLAFVDVIDSDPRLAEIALYEMMRVSVGEKDDAGAADSAKSLAERYPESPFADEASLRMVLGLVANGQAGEALDAIERRLAARPEEEPGDWTLARALANRALGRLRPAMDDASRVAYEGFQKTATERARDLIRELQGQGVAPTYPTQGRLDELFDAYFDKGHFITAGWIADRAAAIYPGTATARRLETRGVGCLIYRNRWGSARSAYKSAARHDTATAEDRALAVVYATRVGALEKAGLAERRAALANAARMAPGSRAAAEAHFTLGKFAIDNGDHETAAREYEEAARIAKSGWLAYEAAWNAGFARYLSGKFDLAARDFLELIEQDPEHKDRDRAMYWRGRALERSKLPDEAAAIYAQVVQVWPRTYYGLAAEARLAELGRDATAARGDLSRDAGAAMWPGVLAIAKEHRQEGGGGDIDEGARRALISWATQGWERTRNVTAAVLVLVEAGLHAHAERLCDVVFAQMDEGVADARAPYYLSIAYAAAGDQLGSIKAADLSARLIRSRRLSDPDGLVARRQYPFLHFDLIEKNAKEKDLDPFLVIALIKQESAFQTGAHSFANARGLMQVIPATGRYIANRRGIKGKYNLYEPKTSVDFGTWYFARAYHATGNDVARTLAGYNAGPGRATRWWGANEGRTQEEVIEMIPFDETRNYVKIILRNWEMYQRLYRDEPDSKRPNELRVLTRRIGGVSAYDDN
ncbi:transglycosylase SLT domain-containing protein [bacterium]|nr:transglycosylase SLT domain-containing protein [bacterium]